MTKKHLLSILLIFIPVLLFATKLIDGEELSGTWKIVDIRSRNKYNTDAQKYINEHLNSTITFSIDGNVIYKLNNRDSSLNGRWKMTTTVRYIPRPGSTFSDRKYYKTLELTFKNSNDFEHSLFGDIERFKRKKQEFLYVDKDYKITFQKVI